MIQNLKFREEAQFVLCDFDNAVHCQALCTLLNAYMADPMGDHEAHDEAKQRALVKGLKAHPTSITLFMVMDGRFMGLVNGFMNFSTFNLMPFINIHDVFICPEYRGRGLSRKMIGKMKEIARDNGCCKVCLEVRYDNPAAQACYRAEGFEDDVPPMYYWECDLRK
jgi:ribosomal protein S18 acetylase RimI-like enzyme